MSHFFRILFIIVIVSVYANAKSVTKFGLGLAYVSLPEYIGSSNQLNYLFPHPYLYHKSKSLTIEKNTIFNHLYKKNKLAIDISLSGSMPVKSDKNSLRYGMKDLAPTVEIGPNFIYKLISQKKKKNYLNIEVPIRAVWSLSLDNIKSIGYNFSPKLYAFYNINSKFSLSFGTGPTYANAQNNNFFYEVKTYESTQSRKVYKSSQGYSGWKNSIVLRYEKGDFAITSFISHYNLKNSVFINSPLISSKYALFYGTGMTYLF